MTNARVFLREIRVEHTLFGLPFAYTGAIFAARGIPSGHDLLWITIAVLGARTAAMAANRYLDREIDARNPRTQRRALASGALSNSAMFWGVALGFALLAIAAWQLNPLCVRLLPLAVLGLAGYPLCKRFTWLTHFALGVVDGLAPLGAFIAVSGTVTLPALLLFGAVTFWVAGFDILYALMDIKIDRAQGIRSLPARFGEGAGMAVFLLLHIAALLLLIPAGLLGGAAWPYELGVIALALLIQYERTQLFRIRDVFALNDRVFTANMAFSVVFMVTTLAGFTLPR